jgi:3-phosphoshikimate 1-carboxyvinyltransferase
LAVAAACAQGETRFEGVGELRVKESDRLAAVEAGLRVCGVETDSGEDWLAIQGRAGPPPGPAPGASVATQMDHRIAMSFLILGLAAQQPVTIDDSAMIDTSFPGFTAQMAELGAVLG